MSLWFLLLATLLSASLVGWGLFIQVAAIVKQRRSALGLVYKFLGLGPFLWALSQGSENLLLLIATFFMTLAVFLILLTLARDRLLR
jgi:hypothetical protein